MPKLRKILRFTLVGALVSLLLLIGLILAYPLWLPGVAVKVAAYFDVEIARIEADGYSSLTVKELAWQQEGVRVAVGEIGLPSLWNGLRDPTSRRILVRDITVDVQLNEFPAAVAVEEDASTPAEIMEMVFDLVRQVEGYGVTAQYRDLVVRVDDQYLRSLAGEFNGFDDISVAAYWVNQEVVLSLAGALDRADLVAYGLGQEVLTGTLVQEIRGGEYHVHFDGEVDRKPLVLEYTSSEEWMPSHAALTLVMNNEGSLLRTYLPVDDLGGELRFLFNGAEWELITDVKAAADGEDYQMEGEVPIEITARVRGDFDALELETLTLNFPFLQASLSEPVIFSLRELRLAQSSSWLAEIDLNNLPERYAQQAQIKALLKLDPVPPESRIPTGVQVTGTIEIRHNVGRRLGDVTFEGLFSPELIRIEELKAEIGNVAHVEAAGGYDIAKAELLPVSLSVELAENAIRPFLPDELEIGRVSATGELAGQIDDLRGGITLLVEDIVHEQQQVERLTVELTADAGKKFSIRSEATGSPLSVELEAMGDFDLDFLDVTLTKADIATASDQFSLVQPASLRLDLDPALLVTWSDLEWAGPGDSKIELSGRYTDGKVQAVRFALDNLGGGIANNWIPARTELEDLMIYRFRLVSRLQENGYLEWVLENRMSYQDEAHGRANLVVEAGSSPDGTVLKTLELAFQNEPLVVGQGIFPVSLVWRGDAPDLEVDMEGPLQAYLEVLENSAVLELLSELTDIGVKDLKLSAAVTGTLSTPEGLVEMSASEVRTAYEVAQEAVTIREPSLKLGIQRDKVEVSELNLRVRDSRLQGQVAYRMEEGEWQQLIARESLPDIERVTAELTLSETPFAEIAALAPDLLTPEGSIAARLVVQSGFHLDGSISLDGVSTRTLPNGYRLSNLSAEIGLDRRKIILREISGRLGNQTAYVSGELDLADLENPRGEFRLHGQNLPLVRDGDVLIRSDLDLRLVMQSLENARITGDVNLRESLLFMDIADMVRRGPATPQSRPPYFSVDTSPVNNWGLNVRVRGNRFLRVDSTAFRGLISVDMRLEGTLEEPQAIGEAQISEGTIRFPFGRLATRTGYVRITRDNPYEPLLDITAEGKVYGYQVDMTVTGTASAPEIQLASVPSATDNELLLMLSTGAIPSGNVLTTSQRTAQAALYFTQDLIGDFFDLPVEDNLSIESGRDISEQGRTTLELEYRLDKKWSITGEYDRFDQYNAGVKWRFFSR